MAKPTKKLEGKASEKRDADAAQPVNGVQKAEKGRKKLPIARSYTIKRGFG